MGYSKYTVVDTNEITRLAQNLPFPITIIYPCFLLLPLCKLFSTRCSTRAVFPVPGPPLMMTPLLVGRCEVRIEWSSRKIHCLPINVDWWLEGEEEEDDRDEQGTSNCNGFSDRNTCCCRFIWLWLLTSCKCLSLNFWLEVALLLQAEEEAALDIASSSSPPPCCWLPWKQEWIFFQSSQKGT